MFKRILRAQLLVLLILSACSPKEEKGPEVAAEENTQCPYKLPWPSFLPEVPVTQSISDLTNKSHLPDTPEEFAIDFFMPEETPIIASRAGTLRAMNNKGVGGGDDEKYIPETNFVFIDHGDGTAAFYGHLMHLEEPIFAKTDINNRQVKQGELIGYSGNTGWSTRPHLHFQVQNNTTGYGQSIPFCFSDVEGGTPLLHEKYVSSNEMLGVSGPQVESYTETFSLNLKAFSGEISFFTVDEANEELAFVVYDLATGNEESTILTREDPFNPLATYHVWSSDGKTMFGSFGYGVYSKNYETGEIKLLLEPEGEMEFVPDYWAPVMDWVKAKYDEGLVIDCLYVEHGRSPPPVYSGICWFSLTMNEVYIYWRDPEDGTLTQSDVDYAYPSSSSDASGIIFMRQYFSEGNPVGNAQLVFFDSVESTFSVVETESVQPIFPKMSQDGKRILFLGYTNDGEKNAGIWIVDADGSNLRQIVAFPESVTSGSIDWSEDDEKIVYSKSSDLWIFDFATNKEIQITYTPDVIEVQPVFRPNQ